MKTASVGDHRDGDDLANHLGLLGDQERPGPQVVDGHRGEQHRGRSAARDSQGQRRDDVAADAGVVAGFRGDEAFDRAMPELFGRLAGLLGREVGQPGRGVAADTGNDADDDADYRRTKDQPFVLQDLEQARHDATDIGLDLNVLPLAQRIEHLRNPVGADQHRNQRKTAGERLEIEGEAVGSHGSNRRRPSSAPDRESRRSSL